MTDSKELEARISGVLATIPAGIAVVAAAKTRTPEEVLAALAAGVRLVGENYVQEAHAAQAVVGRGAAEWHLIGHLQRNKVKEAVRVFDVIQSVDSLRLAAKLDEECRKIGRAMPILLEVNSGREPQKAGVLPEDVVDVAIAVSELHSLRIDGLMTMGPAARDPNDLRPAFAETRRLFERIAARLPRFVLRTLSMGMSDSYRVAIEEGATMIRLGTSLFGPREEPG